MKEKTLQVTLLATNRCCSPLVLSRYWRYVETVPMYHHQATKVNHVMSSTTNNDNANKTNNRIETTRKKAVKTVMVTLLVCGIHYRGITLSLAQQSGQYKSFIRRTPLRF